MWIDFFMLICFLFEKKTDSGFLPEKIFDLNYLELQWWSFVLTHRVQAQNHSRIFLTTMVAKRISKIQSYFSYEIILSIQKQEREISLEYSLHLSTRWRKSPIWNLSFYVYFFLVGHTAVSYAPSPISCNNLASVCAFDVLKPKLEYKMDFKNANGFGK